MAKKIKRMVPPAPLQSPEKRGISLANTISLFVVFLTIIGTIIAVDNCNQNRKSAKLAEAQNAPHLTLIELKFDTLFAGHNIHLFYTLKNVGENTVRITGDQTVFSIGNKQSTWERFDSANPPIMKGNLTMAKGEPSTIGIGTSYPISFDDWVSLRQRKAYVYFMAVVHYEDLVTGSKGVYKSISRHNPFFDYIEMISEE